MAGVPVTGAPARPLAQAHCDCDHDHDHDGGAHRPTAAEELVLLKTPSDFHLSARRSTPLKIVSIIAGFYFPLQYKKAKNI